jgi:eukaryotic-like serine/threonine-protein kinase
MQAEQWQAIERIFQTAVALKGEERTAYLDQACRGDMALRREVESLLAAYEKTGSFMNVPAHEVAARLLERDQLTSFENRPTVKLSAHARWSNLRHPSRSKPALHKRHWIVLASLYLALMLCYTGVKCYVNMAFILGVSGDPKWYARQDDGGVRVTGFTDHDRRLTSSLRVGDEILAINGKQFTNIDRTLEREIYPLEPGSSYTLTIRRDGHLHEFTLTTVRPESSIMLYIFLWGVLTPALYFLTGFTLFVLRPSDTRGVLLALYLAAAASQTIFSADFPAWTVGFLLIGNFIRGGFVPNAAPLLLHFSLIFPETSPLVRRYPRVKYWIYLPLLVSLPLNALHTLRLAASHEDADNFIFQHPWIHWLAGLMFFLYLAASVLSQIINYRRLSPAGQRTARVVLAGVLAAILPIMFRIVLELVFGWELISRTLSLLHPSLYGWFQATVFGMTALLPLTFAYAILRHRVIPVSVIIRRTVQYLFAKNALRFVLALPVLGLLVSIFAARHRTLTEILVKNSIYFYLLLITVLGFSLKFRRPWGEWVDRKFFREHYKQDKILRELIEDVKKSEGVAEVSQLVGRKVDASLHPESLYSFYRDSERPDLSLVYSSAGSYQGLCIPEEFQLLRQMENLDRAQGFPFPAKVDLPQVEKGWLSELGIELIVPMTGTDHRLAGLFLLGAKKSEVPYTAGDRELLDALAGQIAMVYENARLRDRVERDRKVRREVLARIERREINLLKECPRCGACYDGFAQVCESDGMELTLSLPVERTIDGRYRLDRLIGRGGMGAVFEASDLRLGRRVAVKILGGHLFGDSRALRRFEREAQAAARLNHPHIIAVYDYGALETEGAYLVMELVEGETLGALLKRVGKLDPKQTAELFDQVLEGVAAAHAAGVVHRDLKPDNLLLTHLREGATQVKILDFGLAKLAHPERSEASWISESVTMPGTVMGTFGYMSPEQLMGETADERSDIFAVGVMMSEALTGQPPFGGRTYQELLASVLQGGFHLPHDTEVARRLDVVLQRCLAKDRKLRYVSAEEMRRELIQAMREYVTPNNGAPKA